MKRPEFGNSPKKQDPGPANYQELKAFGSDKKQNFTFGGKYKWKANNNPPPGSYQTDRSLAVTKPRVSTMVMREEQKVLLENFVI